MLKNNMISFLKKYFALINRLIYSFMVLWVFIVGYGETQYQIDAHNIILATVTKYDIDIDYCIYIKPVALFYSAPIIGCIYAALYLVEKRVFLEAKWKRWAVFIAALMAFWRVLSDSYTWVLSINLLLANKVISLFLILGNFVVFYKLLCLLFSAFLANRDSSDLQERPLQKLERHIGKNRLFILIWVVFMMCWLPRLILNYPMAIDWDAGKMLHTALTGVDYGYPAVQVMLLKIIYHLGRLVGSIENVLFVYMCMKFLLSTLLFAAIMFYFQQKKCSPCIWYIVLGIILCCPIFQSWSIYISKDSNYSICFVGLLWSICILILDKKAVLSHKILWTVMVVVSAAGVFYLRGNGVYIDILFLMTALISFADFSRMKQRIKKINFKWWKVMALMVICLGITIGISAFKTYTAGFESGNIPIEVKDEEGEMGRIFENLKLHGRKYLKFYISRLGYFFRTEAIPRYAAIARQNCPEEVIEILGDDWRILYEMKYTADNGAQPTSIMEINIDRQNALMKYIIFNEPIMFMESIFTKIHGYFNIFKQWTPTYDGGISQGVYEKYNLKQYLRNENEWWLRARLNVTAYNVFRSICVLGVTCNTGIYVWLLIITSVYLLIQRGREVLCILSPCWLTLLGAMVSGYNAYMRLCLPFVFCIPILLLMCTINSRETHEL